MEGNTKEKWKADYLMLREHGLDHDQAFYMVSRRYINYTREVMGYYLAQTSWVEMFLRQRKLRREDKEAEGVKCGTSKKEKRGKKK